MPAGITGLWQVTARAHASFAEALEMDVAYVRGWSLGLDVSLLLRTPVEVLRQRRATVYEAGRAPSWHGRGGRSPATDTVRRRSGRARLLGAESGAQPP